MEWYENKDAWFDCFEILEIDENASDEEIKHSYRELMKKYHPDNLETGDIEKVRKIKLAYDTIKDSEKRKKYILFSKVYKRARAKRNKEESFEDIVRNYKEKESQVKIAINILIEKVEKKEQQFSTVYAEFCNVLKNKKMNSSEFEIRKQKLRSVELAILSNIKELNEQIQNDLKSLDLGCEKKKLWQLFYKMKKADIILTSNYKQAILELQISSVKFKKRYAAIIPASVLLGILYFSNPLKKDEVNKQEEKIITEIDLGSDILEEAKSIAPKETLTTVLSDYNKDIESKKKDPIDETKKELVENCILFQEVPEDITYDKISSLYYTRNVEVVRADKDGIGYLLDANDHHVIIANYLSFGESRFEWTVLGIDGYDYVLDASDLRTVLDVYPASAHEESEPFYLEGYGYVIEATFCGSNVLYDAETRYPLVTVYTDYSELYYDEEFDCDVYCFTKKDSLKYYVQADDLRKVLKIER